VAVPWEEGDDADDDESDDFDPESDVPF